MGPPLTMLAEGASSLKHRGLVASILDRLPDLMKPVETCHQLLFMPLRIMLDSPQSPLPQRILT
jgi:hypothetical protein